jgi:RNA polymerase sigma factor (sigma-70 family)
LTQLANLVRVEWVMPVYGSPRLSARAKDERSFEAMFRRHHAPLLSYCRHMLGDRDEAEDALQQAFIRAHRAMLGGTKPREVRPWLYAIARNCCLSAIAARKPTEPLQDHMPTLAGLSEQVRRREDLRELVAGIARLPEDQRSALLLAELEDLDHREIAEIVGCPVNKVKALIYQARSTLIADRDALKTPCQDIREQLAVARGGELRRGRLRRHLNLCAGCRDFQLAVGAQRQSLATVLPVLPTAGLASAILGHAAAHTVGAAAGGGAVGGAGLSASGAAATSTAVGAGAGAGGGSGIGTLLGGGLATKLAVGGTVAVLATAGAVAIRPPAHADQRSLQSGSRHGALRRDGPSTSAGVDGAMLDTAFVQTGGDAPGPGASGSRASGSRAIASVLGGAGGSAVAAPSAGIAGAIGTPLAQAAATSPALPTPSGNAAGMSGKPSHVDRRRPISKMHRAAQRKLRRQRLRARRRLRKQRRALERRQMLKRRRQLKRRQMADRRSKRVASSPRTPAAAAPAPTPARPPHRHRPRTTTTSTSETSSSSSTSSTTAGAPTPKTSGRRRPRAVLGPSTGEAEAGASGAASTTTGSATSKHAANGEPPGAGDPGSDAQACGGAMGNSASTTIQLRRDAVGHTHTCPAARQEEA